MTRFILAILLSGSLIHAREQAGSLIFRVTSEDFIGDPKDRALFGEGEVPDLQLSSIRHRTQDSLGLISEDEKRDEFYPRFLWRNIENVFQRPIHWSKKDWMYAGGVLVAVKLSFSLDDQATSLIQGSRTPGSRTFGKEIGKFGMEYGWATLGSFYLAGSLFGSDKAKSVARDGLTANLIAAGMITPLLKEVTGRSRPILGEGSNDFVPFSGNHSFPSGHTTQAFAIASTIAAHYPEHRWVQITSYGIATMVGLSRMESDAHFVSDVLAGAAIGTFVGLEVTRRGKNGGKYKLGPYFAKGRAGVSLRFQQF
jgi:membrane-associated phospholipid phosphatase